MAINTEGLSTKQLDSAHTKLKIGEEINEGVLLSYASATSDYRKCPAGGDAVAVSTNHFDPTDPGQPSDGFTAVKLLNGEGTFELTTDEASVAVGEFFYTAADGKVSKTYAPGPVFVASEAVATAGAGARFNARLLPQAIRAYRHTVTAAEASANSVDIDTGWGGAAVIAPPLVNDALESGWTVSESSGTVTIAATSLSENDVITFLAVPTA